jgi:hypothetical protein
MHRDHRILVDTAAGDDGQVLTNKTSQRSSMYGGSFASGKSTRPLAIFSCSPLLAWMLGAPTSSAVNATTGKRHTCAFTWNKSGGATRETFLAWLKANFHDTHDADGKELHENGCIFKASVEDPVIVIFDGHESHYAPEVLDFCLANGIHLVCRPPHTSQVSQGEDVINFKVLKKLIREAVGRRLARRVLESLHGGHARTGISWTVFASLGRQPLGRATA